MSAETLGDRIKFIRGSLSQGEFAELLDVGRSTLIRYENNSHKPDSDFIMKLHMLYKIQPLWFLTGVGQMVSGEILSKREKKLVKKFRLMDDQQKAIIEGVFNLLPFDVESDEHYVDVRDVLKARKSGGKENG